MAWRPAKGTPRPLVTEWPIWFTMFEGEVCFLFEGVHLSTLMGGSRFFSKRERAGGGGGGVLIF